jgi:hypothetical protein
MRRLKRLLLIVLAIIFLIEAWLWTHLEPIVRWLVACIPLRAIKARLRNAIRWLPPVAVLPVFIVPVVALLPVKFLGLWLLAQGAWFSASLTLVLAKFVSMGVTAFIIELTRPKLLQLAWFRWLDTHVRAWLAWAHELVDPIKERARAMLRLFGPKRAGRTLRLLWRIRRRAQTHPAGT